MEELDLSLADATKKAMSQISAPVVAITLVLLPVFVPIAFVPGLSGQLFRQFAVTVSASMLISAINALTPSPALCATFLRHGDAKRRFVAHAFGGIEKAQKAYASIVRRLGVSIISLIVVAGCGFGIFDLARMTPTSFLPEEDQGAFFIAIQLPDRASLQRTSDAVGSVEKNVGDMPQVKDVFTILACSLLDSAAESNAAFIVAKLKPFEDRSGAADSAQTLIGKVFAEGTQVRTANGSSLNLPEIIGLSTSGGFEYQLDALEGQGPVAIGRMPQWLVASANGDKCLTRVFSTYTTENPSLYLNIDREKAQALVSA